MKDILHSFLKSYWHEFGPKLYSDVRNAFREYKSASSPQDVDVLITQLREIKSRGLGFESAEDAFRSTEGKDFWQNYALVLSNGDIDSIFDEYNMK